MLPNTCSPCQVGETPRAAEQIVAPATVELEHRPGRRAIGARSGAGIEDPDNRRRGRPAGHGCGRRRRRHSPGSGPRAGLAARRAGRERAPSRCAPRRPRRRAPPAGSACRRRRRRCSRRRRRPAARSRAARRGTHSDDQIAGSGGSGRRSRAVRRTRPAASREPLGRCVSEMTATACGLPQRSASTSLAAPKRTGSSAGSPVSASAAAIARAALRRRRDRGC